MQTVRQELLKIYIYYEVAQRANLTAVGAVLSVCKERFNKCRNILYEGKWTKVNDTEKLKRCHNQNNELQIVGHQISLAYGVEQ